MRIVYMMCLLLSVGLSRQFQVTGHTMIMAMVEELIKDKFYYEQMVDILQIMTPYAREKNHVFIESSVWFEDIFYKIDWVQFKNWHFQGEFLSGERLVPTSEYPSLGLEENPITMSDGINYTLTALKSTKQSAVDDHLMKCISLRGLVHLVQDMHQPMHNVSRFDNDKFPPPIGDRGGNSFVIDHPDKLLHKYWDHLLDAYPKTPLPLSEPDHARVRSDAVELLTSLRNDPEVTRRAAIMDTAEWVREGIQLTVEHVYRGIQPNQKPSREYMENGQVVIKKQMVLAAL